MILELSIFICGASVMALELSGARVLAPYLGTSSFVWTSLIGIVLAALSIGYTVGGRLIDTYPNKTFYSRIILIAGLLTASVTILQYPVLIALTSSISDLRVAAVIASILLFGAPSVVLGMIPPAAIRLRLEDVENAGKSVGRLYAISTIGSIVGTFAAGFFLLAIIGTNMMFFALGILLVLTSILVDYRAILPIKALSLLVLCAGAYLLEDFRAIVAEHGLKDLDTAYQRVMVVEGKSTPDERTTRYLITDPLGSQSAMYVDNPTELVGNYARFYPMITYAAPTAKQILLLGGGAFSLPKNMLSADPDLSMDVVELDPGITEIAQKYFELDAEAFNGRLGIFHEDARTFLNRNTKRYDAIFLDVFGSSPTVPFHLTTREAIERMHAALTDEGVLIANLITAIEGDNGRYLRAQIRTIREFFPHVELYPISEPENGMRVQNCILVARQERSPKPGPETSAISDILAHRWQKELPEDVPILEDNFAPVEYYMLPALMSMKERHESEGT